MLFNGLLDLPWWGLVLVALGLTHITIAAVTIYLHRNQAHRALDLHPAVAHFFRLWLWMTTGMITKEWTAIHRKHHAKCETAEDPHSPQVYGINRVLWTGVLLYVKESHHPETMERYGHGTPDDWVERNLYARYSAFGLWLMGAIDIALFGVIPGAVILIVQIAWIPFWAAGVINGVGHFFGYRNWDVPAPDASRNISPIGILIGGEELHNNHHAYPASAKFSLKWYEFDLGWTYIRALESLGLATVKKVAPTPRFSDPKPVADEQTLRGDHRQPLRRAGALRRLAQAHLQPGTRAARPLVRGGGIAEAGQALLRAPAAALRGRARASGRSGQELEAARDGDRDARRAGGALGALERFARPVAQAAAGLVPQGGNQRRSAPGRIQPQAAPLRLVDRRSRESGSP